MIYIGVLIIIISPPPPGETPPPQPIVQEYEPQPEQPDLIYVTCEVCGWRSGYDSIPSAKMGLAGHRGKACKRQPRKNLF